MLRNCSNQVGLQLNSEAGAQGAVRREEGWNGYPLCTSAPPRRVSGTGKPVLFGFNAALFRLPVAAPPAGQSDGLY